MTNLHIPLRPLKQWYRILWFLIRDSSVLLQGLLLLRRELRAFAVRHRACDDVYRRWGRWSAISVRLLATLALTGSADVQHPKQTART